MLILLGATGMGTAVKFIPAAGRRRLHQRHRAC